MADVELAIDARDGTGESPVWDPRSQSLWWTDIPGRRLANWHPSTGEHRIFATPGRVGSLAMRETGGLVLAMEQGFSTFDPTTGDFETLAQPEAGLADHRFNDGRCDPAGRFLAGSMNLAGDADSGQLWRLDRDGSVSRLAGGVMVANGLAFSPDGRLLYWADTPRETVYVFDYDTADGTASNQRIWLSPGHAPGRPDGAAVDTDGCYWSARWGGAAIIRFTPTGAIDRIIHLPVSQVTMCAFGGPNLRTLYVTSARIRLDEEQLAKESLAGGVFALDSGVAGLSEPRFRG